VKFLHDRKYIGEDDEFTVFGLILFAEDKKIYNVVQARISDVILFQILTFYIFMSSANRSNL
jgi:predicted HTH transcriptional regulator